MRTGRSGVITRLVQPSPAERRAALVGDRFERANHGGADGDDAMSGAPGGVDALGRVTRHAVELLVRRLVILEAGHAGVQERPARSERRAETSRVTSSGVNGRPADGISALPGSVANTV